MGVILDISATHYEMFVFVIFGAHPPHILWVGGNGSFLMLHPTPHPRMGGQASGGDNGRDDDGS